jgi:hypothetical protein
LPAAGRSAARTVAGVAAVALGLGFVVAQTSTATPVPVLAPAVRTLGAAAVAATPPGTSFVLRDAADYPGAEGVALVLERAGVDVAVADPTLVTRFGPSRFVADPAGRTELVVTAPDRIDVLERDGWTVLAACGPGVDSRGEATLGGLVAVRGRSAPGRSAAPEIELPPPACA